MKSVTRAESGSPSSNLVSLWIRSDIALLNGAFGHHVMSHYFVKIKVGDRTTPNVACFVRSGTSTDHSLPFAELRWQALVEHLRCKLDCLQEAGRIALHAHSKRCDADHSMATGDVLRARADGDQPRSVDLGVASDSARRGWRIPQGARKRLECFRERPVIRGLCREARQSPRADSKYVLRVELAHCDRTACRGSRLASNPRAAGAERQQFSRSIGTATLTGG
jgi:hypothetical protein